MKNHFRVWVWPITFAILSLGIKIISEKQVLDLLLSKIFVKESIPDVKMAITILSYILFVAPLVIQSITRGNKAASLDSVVSKYINDQKKLVYTSLSEQNCVQGAVEDINLRIFVKKNDSLVLLNDDYSTRKINAKLSFSISKQEGACSLAYSLGRTFLEAINGLGEEYNLTERQKALIEDVHFVVAVPIHPDHGKKIKYVICFDSQRSIAKPGKESTIMNVCENIAYQISSVL